MMTKQAHRKLAADDMAKAVASLAVAERHMWRAAAHETKASGKSVNNPTGLAMVLHEYARVCKRGLGQMRQKAGRRR